MLGTPFAQWSSMKISYKKNLLFVMLLAATLTRVNADDQTSSNKDKSSSDTVSSAKSDDSKSSDSNSAKSDSSSSKANSNSSQSDDSSSSKSNSDSESSKASSGTPSPVQSKADPYGLKVAGEVMVGGSDSASKSFMQNVLPSLSQFVNKALPESKNNTKSAAFQIDPNKLTLATSGNVRDYFVSEGASFHNAIGFDAVTGKDPKSSWDEVNSDSSKLIFPDASSSTGSLTDGTGKSGVRTASEPVLAGDFVDLGKQSAGTKLDFFLMANGARQSWSSIFSANSALNGDGFSQHIAGFTASLFAIPSLNSPYIFLSFEDLWGGGDKDINDTIIAIDIGAKNVAALLATPEPSMWLTLATLLAAAFWAKRRLDRHASLSR